MVCQRSSVVPQFSSILFVQLFVHPLENSIKQDFSGLFTRHALLEQQTGSNETI